MYLWLSVAFAVIAWPLIYAFYLWDDIKKWFDNKFGPDHVEPKVCKPRKRKRMYE